MVEKLNDEGISAVMGVILVVAITVVLAAVIAQFGLQFNNDLQKHYNIGIKVERSSPTVIVVKTIAGQTEMLLTGGVDHHVRSEASYRCKVNGVQVNPVDIDGIEIPDGTGNFDSSSIGAYTYYLANQNDDLTIIAQFTDGSETVLYSGISP